MSRIKPLFLSGIFLLLFCTCERELPYSIIPEITEYTGFDYYMDEVFHSPKGKISFSFVDGDGDVGLGVADTLPPFDRGSEYHYNLHLFYYEKQDGQFVRIDPPLPLHTRIPVLSEHTPESIEVKFSINLDINPLSPFDTIKLEFFIYDRALHKSNTISTPEIVLPRRG